MSKRKILLGTILILGLGGLATAFVKQDWMASLGLVNEERAVRRRIEGYWNARLTGSLEALAPYMHPMQKQIQANSILVTESFELMDIKVDGDNATARLKASYRFKHPTLSRTKRDLTISDRWVRYKGQWYKTPHPVGFGELLQQGLGNWKPQVDSN